MPGTHTRDSVIFFVVFSRCRSRDPISSSIATINGRRLRFYATLLFTIKKLPSCISNVLKILSRLVRRGQTLPSLHPVPHFLLCVCVSMSINFTQPLLGFYVDLSPYLASCPCVAGSVECKVPKAKAAGPSGDGERCKISK